MALPSSWVERIFARMLVRYGADWLRKWDGIDLEAVKADWADQLDGMRAEALAYALDHLPPDRPPTVSQFREIAHRVPRPMPTMLPAPSATPEVVRKAVSSITRNVVKPATQWAARLRELEERGGNLTAAQRAMWRAALPKVEGVSDEQA